MIAVADNESPNIAALHQALVDKLIDGEIITTEAVETAFRAVPRHLFLPDIPLEKVYSDQAIPTKFQNGRAISSSSQPAIMAIMLEQLALQSGHRVLEIGAGTGYNAALMAYLVGDEGHVTTVDLDEDTAVSAGEHLAAAGYEQVDVVCGDGMVGYPDNAPYDRIILTVGGWDIPPPWLAQLKPDGRILLPFSINGPQLSVAFERTGEHLTSTSIRPCGFMRLRGQQAEPRTWLELDSEPGLTLDFMGERPSVDAETVYQWLTDSCQTRPTEIQATPHQIWSSLLLWLALNEPHICGLSVRGAMAEKGVVPYLFGVDGEKRWQSTIGILAENGLSLLMRPPDELPPIDPKDGLMPVFELFVCRFGADEALAQRLHDHIRAWDRNGRPDSEGLRIRAYATGTKYKHKPTTNEYILAKQWRYFVLDWPIEE